MIIKKIRRKTPARATAGSEFAYVARLTRYVVRADPADLRKLGLYEDAAHVQDLLGYVNKEEVIASGAVNLLGKALEQQQAEMQALVHRCKNGAGALDHWVMSWPEGDKPTVSEVEKSISIFLRCQGLENCPVVWAIHNDTDNLHAHLAVLRIDSVTAERVTAGEGWDIDCAMRAKAVIESEFPHWQREEGSIYVVRAGKLVRTRDNVEIGPADKPQLWTRVRSKSRKEAKVQEGPEPVDVTACLDQSSRDYEQETGLKSRERIALEIAVPIALESTSWDECHRRLAAEGIAIQRTRYGANFVIEGKPVKASIDRSTSYARLKERFGGEEFKPSSHTVKNVAPRELWPEGSQRREYYQAKRSHNARMRAIIARFRGRHRGRAGVAVAPEALAAAQAAASFPSFDEWVSGSQPPEPADVIARTLGFGVIEATKPRDVPPQQQAIADFKALKLRDRVIYYRPSDPPGRPSFIDHGDRIVIHAAKDRDAVRAALLLLVKNNPGCEIAVIGDRSFKKLALEIANQEGVRLHGPLGEKQAQLRREPSTKPTPADREQSYQTDPKVPSSPPVSHEVPNSRPSAGPSKPQSHSIPQPAKPATHEGRRDAILAMVGRLFHLGDWDPGEFWPKSMRGKLNDGLTTTPRTFDEIRTGDSVPAPKTVSTDSADTKAQAAEAARRAAAIAAASRSF